ncbi:hypothetical protein ABEV54_19785 [Peribacillus psychrosaccharolyticus]|uniref:hypothetical protein n=1 Tax=Peribacillus psychrosaccharolyticus TaxID=1407 RepID=UPI0013785C45|nr:hypothetical protein [Peribacillus psychrosaccharolyticus]MEC2054100.1 hypothetical protein [Peribacillus psychrosaccharolyticus]MED3742279.1 hypothetical protein [Peribacillus psychrosaccharolyticus]
MWITNSESLIIEEISMPKIDKDHPVMSSHCFYLSSKPWFRMMALRRFLTLIG